MAHRKTFPAKREFMLDPAPQLAALKKLLSDGVIDRSESVALIVTGFGLNQPDATVDNSQAPVDLASLRSEDD